MPMLRHRAAPRTRARAPAASAARVSQVRRAGLLGGLFGGFAGGGGAAQAAQEEDAHGKGPTNEVLGVVNGIEQRRLGDSDVIVSAVGLGTQRWGSTDFNAPDEAECLAMLDWATDHGINLVDTAEQYPIPSGQGRQAEGYTESIIGSWINGDSKRRERLVVATKITGGSNINARTIVKDVEGSLRRLGTDYVDVYLAHWPSRYTPQSNWGQSLEYDLETEAAPWYRNAMPFEEYAEAMSRLIAEGKIRGYGCCNDNGYGLGALAGAARCAGVPRPIAFQGDYSILNRRSSENGLSEGCSPLHENCGFMAYNVLAGGMLTGKYRKTPAAFDIYEAGDERAAAKLFRAPRGRMDTTGWGPTLYRYRTKAAVEAIEAYADIAATHLRGGGSDDKRLLELALRWVTESRSSFVTTALLGSASLPQLQESLSLVRLDASVPPLSEALLWSVDVVHLRNRLPLFSRDDGDGGSGLLASPSNRGGIGERVP